MSGDQRDERGDELAQLARRREVLVLVGHVHELDAVGRREALDHLLDEVLGRARAGGHADDAGVAERVEVELVGAVDPQRRRGHRRSVATLASAIVFDEFALPITTTASARAAIAESAS